MTAGVVQKLLDLDLRFVHAPSASQHVGHQPSVFRSLRDGLEKFRDGASAQTVLRLYLNEYKVEHTYRLMKSGLGVDRVFFRTPSRENAMMFVVGIATLIENIIDAMNRRNGDRDTFRTVIDQFECVIVRYDRSDDSMDFEGPDERVEQLFRYLDTMRTDPVLLLSRV